MIGKVKFAKMHNCIRAAQKIMEQSGLREYQSDILGIAITFYKDYD